MFTFKPLEIKDFKQLFVWLQDPSVKMYWDPDINYSQEMIYDKYYPRLSSDVIKMYIIKDNANVVGFIQSYINSDLSNYGFDESVVGMDLYIGNYNYLHKGYGKTIIKDFINDILFIDKSINTCLVDPSVDNTIAQQAYYKAGFTYVKTVFSKSENKELYLMKYSRTSEKL